MSYDFSSLRELLASSGPSSGGSSTTAGLRELADLLDPRSTVGPDPLLYADDPLGFMATWWPSLVAPGREGLPEDPRDRLRIAPYQREIILSVRDNVETVVVAGNKLGKDWVAGFICVWAFACHPVARIVTTSVAEHHLKVLWGEIGRWLATSYLPLLKARGGPLVELSQEVRRADEASSRNPLSYLVGRVCSGEGEGLAGHHAPYTLGVVDEASGVDDRAYEQMQGWMKRSLLIGNPNNCPESQFFRRMAEEGDIK